MHAQSYYAIKTVVKNAALETAKMAKSAIDKVNEDLELPLKPDHSYD